MPLDPGQNTELQSKISAQQETKQMLITRVPEQTRDGQSSDMRQPRFPKGPLE